MQPQFVNTSTLHIENEEYASNVSAHRSITIATTRRQSSTSANSATRRFNYYLLVSTLLILVLEYVSAESHDVDSDVMLMNNKLSQPQYAYVEDQPQSLSSAYFYRYPSRAGRYYVSRAENYADMSPLFLQNPLLNPIIQGRLRAAVKRSAASAPAAVKRERIIMDAMGGDYLIRKRTLY